MPHRFRAILAVLTGLWACAYGAATAAVAAALLGAAPARADLPSDVGSAPRAATLATPPSKHWVWVNDFVFPHMADGMAYLIDGDTGGYLGTLSTGYGFGRVVLAPDGRLIYSPETYFSRGTRGIRSDVVTVYDAATLQVAGEIAIPPKRSSNLPMMANSVLTDDGRYLLIYNFNPAQSVTVVDTVSRKFVREIETPGCALVFPTGPRSFFSVCGDGSLLLVGLRATGADRAQRTKPLFDMRADPVTEKAVRLGRTWYFVSYDGRVYPLEAGPDGATVGPSWWLASEAERAQGWRPGGVQPLAVDAHRSELFAVMHRGGRATHKEPGRDVWVFDASSGRRVRQFALRGPASAIQLSSDTRPLFYSMFMDAASLDIYDPANGRLLRSAGHVGTTPTIMVTP